MSTRFFTNHGDQTLLRKFQGVFESNTDIEWFDARVGFLRASGYFAIRPFLGNVLNPFIPNYGYNRVLPFQGKIH